MVSKKLVDAAHTALKEYMCVAHDENVLIISDEKTRQIGIALYEAGVSMANETFYVEMRCREINGQEPPEAISDMMKKVDIVVCATTRSLTHTDARRQAVAKGVRVGTMPGITVDTMNRCFSADSKQILELNNKLIELLKKADEVRLVTEKGTDAIFKVKGRKVISSSGVLKNIGDWGNIPSGEVYFAPVEDLSYGKIVCDGSVAGIGLLTESITIDIKDGMITKIQGGSQAKQLDEMLSRVGGKAKAVAEFGIGTNPKAKICGMILEDEKVMGTVHIAFGNNISMEGSIDVPIHIDCIIQNPTFYLDGKAIMENGKFVF